MMQTQVISLPAPHSAGQRRIIEAPGNVALLAGRRYGKTEAAVQRVLMGAQALNGLYWWVGLSWRSASLKRAWRLLKHYARQVWLAMGESTDRRIREVDKEIRLPNGSEVWLRTAERPESLAGEGIRGAVLDEFTLMAEAVWSEYVEPALLDFGGWALFAGVPKGRNWAARLWLDAAQLAGWDQMHFTTYDNPYIPADRIELLKERTPERIFQQEILAEIVDDAGGVFRGVMACATATEQAGPVEGHRYLFGVDWAKHGDWTAIMVLDATTKELAHMDRFNQIDYSLQVGRLRALYDRFRPEQIIAERNSMGEPLAEALIAQNLPVQTFTTTNASKARAIEALSLAIERQEIRILPDPVLVGELQSFESERLPSGMLRYAAPSGYHDDTVLALAIAWSGLGLEGPIFI